MRILIMIPVLLILLLVGDWVTRRSIRNKELLDVLVHGLVALIVVYSLGVPYVFIAFIIAVALDIDHFIVAKSFKISDAIKLKYRPYTHSITFAIFVGCVVWGLTKNTILAFTVILAIASHVLRDASTGVTFILWPFRLLYIPYWSYIMLEIALLIGGWGLKYL